MDDEHRHIHWVKRKTILNSRDNGGLEIEGLDAFNMALLYKWRWRFALEGDTLWLRLIKFLYGKDGGFLNGPRKNLGGGVWHKIIGSINQLHERGVVDKNLMNMVIGDGTTMFCWEDAWCGGVILKDIFPRLYVLSDSQNALIM